MNNKKKKNKKKYWYASDIYCCVICGRELKYTERVYDEKQKGKRFFDDLCPRCM